VINYLNIYNYQNNKHTRKSCHMPVCGWRATATTDSHKAAQIMSNSMLTREHMPQLWQWQMAICFMHWTDFFTHFWQFCTVMFHSWLLQVNLAVDIRRGISIS